MIERAFSSYPDDRRDGLLASLSTEAFFAWGDRALGFGGAGTIFGYVEEGPTMIVDDDAPVMVLHTGMYFSVAAPCQIVGGRGIAILRQNYRGLRSFGGPIEEEGRLKYIDGCTDSLLVPPVRLGDPCMNLLYFPPGIEQTAHTHPSDRIGMVLSGEGECHAWDPVQEDVDVYPLVAGMRFCIHAGGEHRFRTDDYPMRVLAYHPDSDFGPTDEDHPMLNRTIIDGVSAADESRRDVRTR